MVMSKRSGNKGTFGLQVFTSLEISLKKQPKSKEAFGRY
jgi:hypothetical protein